MLVIQFLALRRSALTWFFQSLKLKEGSDTVSSSLNTVNAPVGVSFGRYEIFWPPRKLAEEYHSDLRSYERLDRGGHFLAAEQPELLAQCIRTHFGKPDILNRLF